MARYAVQKGNIFCLSCLSVCPSLSLSLSPTLSLCISLSLYYFYSTLLFSGTLLWSRTAVLMYSIPGTYSWLPYRCYCRSTLSLLSTKYEYYVLTPGYISARRGAAATPSTANNPRCLLCDEGHRPYLTLLVNTIKGAAAIDNMPGETEGEGQQCGSHPPGPSAGQVSGDTEQQRLLATFPCIAVEKHLSYCCNFRTRTRQV